MSCLGWLVPRRATTRIDRGIGQSLMHWEKSHETVSAVAGTSRTVARGRRPHDAVFLAIGTPKKGAKRIAELLSRMRNRRRTALSSWTPEQRLAWGTQMYDELQRLQDATKDAAHRRHGVNLILRGLELCQNSVPDNKAIASY